METLDIDECADFLKISKTTAINLAGSGVLPGAKVGRAWVFLKADIIEYLRATVRLQQRERQNDTIIDQSLVNGEKLDSIALMQFKQTHNRRRPLPKLPDERAAA